MSCILVFKWEERNVLLLFDVDVVLIPIIVIYIQGIF